MARSKTTPTRASVELENQAADMRIMGKGYYTIAAALNLTINQTMRLLHDAYTRRTAEYDPYPESYRLIDEAAKRAIEQQKQRKK